MNLLLQLTTFIEINAAQANNTGRINSLINYYYDYYFFHNFIINGPETHFKIY